jgi:Bifunctional DNA primase/polymerase, N-terminal
MDFRSAALRYAGRGWKIFPCKPGSKVPATPHGVDDATADLDRVYRWWKYRPECNVAVACGAGSIDVLDVDIAESGTGFPALRMVRAQGLAPDPLAVVSTPSGGCHLWFRGTDQRNGRIKEHHLDFRSTGGYVLVPPSVVEGKAYAFEGYKRNAAGTVDWDGVKALLRPPAPPRPVVSGGTAEHLADWLAGIGKGDRNCALFWAACRTAEKGADVEPLIAVAVSIGLSEREARTTVASALRVSGRQLP